MEVKIIGEYIKLDQLLKFSGVCDTGGMAKEVILSEEVLVNGIVEIRRGRKIRSGDIVTFNDVEIVVI